MPSLTAGLPIGFVVEMQEARSVEQPFLWGAWEAACTLSRSCFSWGCSCGCASRREQDAHRRERQSSSQVPDVMLFRCQDRGSAQGTRNQDEPASTPAVEPDAPDGESRNEDVARGKGALCRVD